MPRNRTIYQSESVFVSNNLDSTDVWEHAEVARIQEASYGFSMNKTDVNQYGKSSRIDHINLELPTVNFDMSYLLGNGYNESVLGFDIKEGYQFAKYHLENNSGKNFYVLISEEGLDSKSLEVGDPYTLIGIGNAFLTNYSVDMSVGSLAKVNLQYECSNINSIHGVVEGEGFWLTQLSGDSASINIDKGIPYDKKIKITAPKGDIENIPTALRPGDITINFEGFDSENLSTISGNGSFHLQSANLSIPLSRSELKRLGSKGSYARVLDYPIKATLSVNSIVSNIEVVDLAESVRGCINNSLNNDISILAKDCNKENAIIWRLKNPDLLSENFSSNIGPNKSVDLTFEVEIGNPDDNSIGILCSGASDRDNEEREDDNDYYPTRVYGYDYTGSAAALEEGVFTGESNILLDWQTGDVIEEWKYNRLFTPWRVPKWGNLDFIKRIAPGGSTEYIGDDAFRNIKATGELYLTKNLTGIGTSVFENTNIDYLVVGDGLPKLPSRSFYDCDQLKTVKTADSITEIGDSCFAYSNKLNEFYFSKGLSGIGVGAFHTCSSLLKADLSGCNYLQSINDNTFNSCTSLEEVSLSDSILTLGDDSFKSCTSLTNFKWSSGLESVGDRSFNGCTSLLDPVFYDTLETIGDEAFSTCYSFDSVTIPGTVTYFGEYAFKTCGVKSLVLNEGLSEISYQAFYNCASLKSISFPETLLYINPYCFIYNYRLQNLNIPDNVSGIGNHAFYTCYSAATSQECLDVVNFGSGLKFIGEQAFYGNQSLRSADLPENIESIGYNAFFNCGLSGFVNLPDSLNSIGINAFDSNNYIESINIGAGLTTLSNNCFEECTSLSGVFIPDWFESLNDGVFLRCYDITTISLGNGIEYINDYAFGDCRSLTGIDIPSQITGIGNSAFQTGLNITNVGFVEGLEYIGNSAFANCYSLTGVSFPNTLSGIGSSSFSACSDLSGQIIYTPNLQSVGASAFLGTDIYDVVFNNHPSYNKIEDSTFSNCDFLTGLNLVPNITEIGSSSFANCDILSGINFNETITTIGSSAFSSCVDLSGVSFPDSIEDIGNSAFTNCYDLSFVDFSQNSNYDTISTSCFENCTSLTNVLLPDNVTELGGSCFKGCTSLEYIDLNISVEYIGASAFRGCSVFNNLDLPSSLLTIANDAFKLCYELKSMSVFPENLASIGDDAFNSCDLSGFQSILTIPDSVTYMGLRAFQNNSDNLSGVVLGSGLTNLRSSVFQNCTNLREINLENITSIENSAFKNCLNLTGALIPPNMQSMGTSAFENTAIESIIIPNAITETSTTLCYSSSFLTGIISGLNLITIGNSSFYGCGALSEFYAEDNLRKISSNAFYNCSSMSGLDLNQITELQTSAFKNCDSLPEFLEIPDTVTVMGTNIFEGCTNTTGFSWTSGYNKIPAGTFKGCNNIQTLEIPSYITVVDAEAFMNCTSISGVSFPQGIQYIGGSLRNYNAANGAFKGCVGISGEIILPSSLEQLGRYAFYDSNLISTFKFYSTTAPLTRVDAFPVKFINDPSNNPIHAPSGAEASYSGQSYAPSYSYYGAKSPVNWDSLNIIFDL
jgi:hypothetical protein